ncbi:hypothetical protein L596_027797 [Steinernema carpocapsae]|uniref:G-protein coupled receptors family 1 profile domain-containing protein n=1 Tax=Steinernema carpocapsae TaxID=34508 RepID=A0A4U5LWK1_STECR|nr:hypothetical protein L596_027797 [Steinernema carpocapsae]
MSAFDVGPNATLNASPDGTEVEAEIQLFGLGLVLIPTATILGNLLVIVSVLRFRALHSAINFLILGLAVADLFVALFVMPYAVYVYVQGGYWFLGPLMCDIYSASDVACSTASILLLAVISFDRFRAVSRPIQYSRQAQNTKRVMVILVAIWLISLALASPIVLGVNHRPPDADLYECRFYNAEFSIISSIFSFIIPCVLVLFVYIRIMMALRKRERAARQRRLNNLSSSRREPYEEGDEAGQTVTGPGMRVASVCSAVCGVSFFFFFFSSPSSLKLYFTLLPLLLHFLRPSTSWLLCLQNSLTCTPSVSKQSKNV